MEQMGPKDGLWLDDSTASFVIGYLMVNALMENAAGRSIENGIL